MNFLLSFVGESIQDDCQGHDPEEDAIAAMKLVLLKLEKGYEFGDAVADNVHTRDSISGQFPTISTSLFQQVKDKEKRICVVSSPKIMENYKVVFINHVDKNE